MISGYSCFADGETGAQRDQHFQKYPPIWILNAQFVTGDLCVAGHPHTNTQFVCTFSTVNINLTFSQACDYTCVFAPGLVSCNQKITSYDVIHFDVWLAQSRSVTLKKKTPSQRKERIEIPLYFYSCALMYNGNNLHCNMLAIHGVLSRAAMLSALHATNDPQQ